MKKFLSLFLTFILALNCCIVPGLAADGHYSDTHGHWAEASIERWSNYGIVSGNNGKFKPNDNLTRAQLAVILSNILGLTEEPEICPFDDVKDTDWFAPYIKKCYAAGIMLGNNGKANPNDPITRQEAIVMLCRTLNIKPVDSNDLLVFLDEQAVADYAAPYVTAMVKAGVIKGDDKGNVLPTGMLTRGAIMAIIDRSIVQYINEPGTYELVDKGGIILVTSADVKLTGKTSADLIISAGASGGKVTFENAKVTGEITIQANNTTVESKNSTLPKAEILGKGSKVNNSTSNNQGNNSGSNSSGGTVTPTYQDLVVTEPGSTYSNSTYRNVTIAASVGDGDVTFDNVTITGDITINGGGSNSIHFKYCTTSSIKVNKNIHIFEGATEVPRIELINTPVPKIETLSPTIIEAKDSNSKIQSLMAHNDLEVRGPETVIEEIVAMKNSGNELEFNILAGKIINLISYNQLILQGAPGTINTITTSDNIDIGSGIADTLIVADDAVGDISLNVRTPSDDSLTVDICINSNNGVKITTDMEDPSKISISTNLDKTPSNVSLNGANIEHIHAWDTGIVTKEPTCTENGIKTYTCSVSNCTYDSATKTEVIPALGHSWNEGIVTKKPTCTENGTKTYTCTRENCTSSNAEDIPALDHIWDEGSVTTPATCTVTGVKTYTCIRDDCEDTKTEGIPALGHTPEVIPAKAATCTEKGLTEGSKCSVCQEILVAQEYTDHLGHNWESVTIQATCTTPGRIDKSCTRCDATDSEVIIAKGHNFTGDYFSDSNGHWQKCSACGVSSDSIPHEFNDNGCESLSTCNTCGYEVVFGHDWDAGEVTTAPTCTTDGVKTYTCNVCEETKTEVIPALGHNYSTEFTIDKEATCTEAGSKSKHCSRCDSVTDVTTIPALDHDLEYVAGDNGHTVSCKRCEVNFGTESHEWNDGEVIKEPTCTVIGYKSYLCKLCNGSMEDEIPAKGHTEETVKGTPATCEEAGLTDGTKCSVCGTWITEQETIEALGHDWEHIEGYPATCTEEGLEDGERCSRCGAQDGFTVIMPLLHDWENDYTVDQEATCTTNGSKSIYCSRCDTTKDTQVIPATGHTAVVDEAVDATCTTTGLTEGSHCSVCGEVIKAQEFIEMADHSLERVPGYASSCTEAGLTDGWRCSACGYVDTEQKEIPATGHQSENVDEKAATCEEDGQTSGTKCSVCGEILSGCEIIPATGHSEINVDAIAPTCTEYGQTAGVKCSVCGKIISGCNPIMPEHDYIYINNEDADSHTATCSICNYSEVSGHSYFYVDNGDGTHSGECICGAKHTGGHYTMGPDDSSCFECGAYLGIPDNSDGI